MAYGVVVANQWPALVGASVLVALAAAVLVGWLRARRRRKQAALARCWGLIAEGLVIRQRVSGEIDSATYQQQMNDLAAGRRP